MRKQWWKWVGVLLVAYVVFGGLLTPLKTGITGLDKINIASGSSQSVQINIYNPGKNFSPEIVLLKNEYNQFVADTVTWHKEGTIEATFTPKFGKKGVGGSMFNLFVKANNHWMSFPTALAINKSANDTGDASEAVIDDRTIHADPDKIRGFPNRIILYESVRNLFYHVPMWFSMIFLLSLAAFYAVKYLNTGSLEYDLKADALIKVAILAGVLGCITGAAWARVTWNGWWPKDPKLNGVAIGMLMYCAYLLLRSGVKDEHQRARVSAVYNLFVFPVFIALIIIMPKLAGESNHPGAGGTVTFKQYDLDNTLRMFFYPAVIGWIILYYWVYTLYYRYKKLVFEKMED